MCHSSIAFFLLNLKGGGGFYCILEKLGSLGVVKPFANCKFVLTTKMSFEDRLFANRFDLLIGALPSITDGVHRKENFVEIIPVFSTFSKIFNNKKKIFIKAILCNFSMRLLKYF